MNELRRRWTRVKEWRHLKGPCLNEKKNRRRQKMWHTQQWEVKKGLEGLQADSKEQYGEEAEKESNDMNGRLHKTLLRPLQSTERGCLVCFNHKDGGIVLLQNNGKLLSDYEV
jgi:hypothetical protein